MRRIGGVPLRGVAALAATILLGMTAVEASPRVCRQLEAELAAAGGADATARRYEQAIADQGQQLSVARSRARQAGCGVFAILSPRNCRPLNDQIARMQENLVALQRALGRAADEPQRSRSTILASLEANGCRETLADQRAAEEPLEPDEDATDLFQRVFGDGVVQQDEPPEWEDQASNGPGNVVRILNPSGQTDVYGPSGEFSTTCVRTCDGYFFPVSPNSTAADFDRDRQNCEATCPGTEVRLYYRPVGSDDNDAMMSTANGAPYMSLPNAYVYKDASRPRVPACGCKGAVADPSFSIVGGEPGRAAQPAEAVTPALSEQSDPETAANLAGKPDTETGKGMPKPAAIAPLPPPDERKVRVVGPVFLPDPEAAIDLKAPGRKKAQ
jgi:Protein of unknown function (DUF2865)